jgi:hypothetical protein
VADPNYPGDTTRTIGFADGKYKPYDSAVRAGAPSKKYDLISYVAKTALIPWNQITERWQELEKGAVGGDLFPDFTIYWADDESEKQKVKDGFTTEQPEVELWVESAMLGPEAVGWTMYRDGARLDFDENNRFAMSEGENALGIAVWGDVNGNWKYIGFKRFTVDVTTELETIEEEPYTEEELPSYNDVLGYAEGEMPLDAIDPAIREDINSFLGNSFSLDIMGESGSGMGNVSGGFSLWYLRYPPGVSPDAPAPELEQNIVTGTLEGTYTSSGQDTVLEGNYTATREIDETTTKQASGKWTAEVDDVGNIRIFLVDSEKLTGFEIILEGTIQQYE